MRILAIALLLTFIPSLVAADLLLILNSNNENYVLDTVTKSITPSHDADVRLKDIDAIYKDQQGKPPSPPDDPDPPDDPTDLEDKVRQWALSVGDPDGVFVYSGVYGLLADQIESGAIPATTAGVQKGMQQMLAGVRNFYGTKRREWDNFTQEIADELTRQWHDNGQNLTKAQYVQFFETVKDGMESANQGKALNPFVKTLLKAILTWIMNNLPDWFADAGPVEQQDRFAEFEPRTLDEINEVLRQMAIAEGLEAP